jgi:putative serine protease PepD
MFALDTAVEDRVQDTATQHERDLVDRRGHRRPTSAARRRGFAPFALISTGLLALTLAGCSLSAANGASTTGGSRVGQQAAPTVVVPPSAADLQQTVINVIRTVQPSVVEISSRGASGGAVGSGEIVTTDGYVVTNDHVVDGFSSYSVTLANGQSYPATLKGQAPDDDLALLKIDAKNLQPIAFAESKNVQVGQFAIAIGSPLGLEQSATFGIVSAVNRTANEGADGPARYPLTGLIQTSAPINPGNSGGALVDLQGRLIGVPTLAAANPNSGAAADGIGFAIPSDRVKYVADQLISTGKLTNTGRGFLGIQLQDVTPELAAAYNLPVKSGVLVVGFGQDANGKSPAQDGGVKTGDIITAINGQQIESSSNLSTMLSGLAPGAQITLKIVRGNQTLDVKVTLGERPAR